MTLIVDAHTEDSTSALPEEQNRKALEKIAQRGMPGSENPVEIVAEPDSETVLTSATPRELVISASTRESRIASYLDSWKRKVERVGTLHYPHDLRQQNLKGYPTLEVAIAADGSLEEVIVLASSGHRKLDRAAVEILYLAAPFEPFPEFLTNEYEVLRFAYEWQFTGETTVRASVGLSGES
jgi:protein TonB